MRFVSTGVCIMRYCGPMRYAVQFPAHRLGGRMELCVIRGYALSEVCVKRGSTVPPAFILRDCSHHPQGQPYSIS